jgi:hypothetical protein
VQLLRSDEQIDVAGETPAGIAVDRLAEQRALERGAANPRVGEHGNHAQGDELQEGALPAPCLQRLLDRGGEVVARASVRELQDTWTQRGQELAQAQRLRKSRPVYVRRQPLGSLAHGPPAGGRASAEQDELPFGSEAGHQGSARHGSRWSPTPRQRRRNHDALCSSIFSSSSRLQGKEARSWLR